MALIIENLAQKLKIVVTTLKTVFNFTNNVCCDHEKVFFPQRVVPQNQRETARRIERKILHPLN